VRRDFARFRYFSDGWVARAAADPSFIGDARYSLSTETYAPIWGVRFHPGAAQPTEWVDHTAKNRIPVGELWRELAGRAPGYTALPFAVPSRPAAGG
jgi:inner membrane protein